MDFLADLRSVPGVSIVEASHKLFDRGVALYSQRLDKVVVADGCISFVMMQEQGLSEALTADRHFEQAGFMPLLA